MRSDPQRFVTFVLGSFVLAFWLSLILQTARIWRRTGRCPIMALRGGDWKTWLHALGALVLWPGSVLAWAADPGGFPGLALIPWIEGWPARLAGLLLLCVGASLLLVAALELGDYWRMGPDPESPPAFVSTGIYASLRHPMYAAVGALSLGMFLLAPNALFGAWAAGIWLWIPWQAREEEAFLMERLGEPYRAYLAASGRFIPRRSKSAGTGR